MPELTRDCGGLIDWESPCFVNQLLDRFAWSVNDRSRSNVSSFGAAACNRKAEDRHAREALAQGQSLSPHCRSQSPRSAGQETVIHVSGRFCWVKAKASGSTRHARSRLEGISTRRVGCSGVRTDVPRSLQPCAPQNTSACEYVEARGYFPTDDRCRIIACYTSFDPRGEKVA